MGNFRMYKSVMITALVIVFLVSGCGNSKKKQGDNLEVSHEPEIVVNSPEDIENPPTGTVTLRSALKNIKSGSRIVFDPALDGGTIALTIVGEEHSVLKGEVMGMRMEASGPVSYLEGYLDRDYGRSALYVKKDVVIDASMLQSGITIAWSGVDSGDARILTQVMPEF